eukprot:2906537-Alexandrium_andersonii.AAC.1
MPGEVRGPAEPAPTGGRRLKSNKERFYGEGIHIARGRALGALPYPSGRHSEPSGSRPGSSRG